MSILLTLYWTFFKIGLFAFGGGYAVLPLISQYVVEDCGWLTTSGLTDLVSLSQMTPGPIAINSATFIGTKVAGIPGAIIATVGNITPQLILMMLLGYLLFDRKKKMPFLDKILLALKPGIVSLVAIAGISMVQASVFTNNWHGIQLGGAIGFVLGFAAYAKRKLSLIQLVLVSAGLGLVLHLLGLI